MCTFGCTSQVVTSVLAIVRSISIFQPFVHYEQWIPFAYIFVFCTLMALNEFAFAYCQFLEPTEQVERIIEMAVNACYWMTIMQIVVGIVASVVTFLKLFAKRKVEKNRMRSCWIIFLMNIPYVLSVVNFILSRTRLAKFGYVYLAFVVIPCFTSLFNPLVIVFMTNEIRHFAKKLVKSIGRWFRYNYRQIRGVNVYDLTAKNSASTTASERNYATTTF